MNSRPDELNQWQPEPWGTRSHDDLYHWGRSRIENTNNLAKRDGAMHPEACAAPGTLAHNMAALAVFLANNVTFAAADPLRDPQPDGMPETEPSLFCVTTALHSGNGTGNGAGNSTGNGSSADANTANGAGNGSSAETSTDTKAALPLRAPP